MVSVDIEKLMELLDASSSPWECSREDMDSYAVNTDDTTGKTEHVAYLYRGDEPRAAFFGTKNREDLRLIVAAIDSLPKMLAELTRLRALEAKVREFCKRKNNLPLCVAIGEKNGRGGCPSYVEFVDGFGCEQCRLDYFGLYDWDKTRVGGLEVTEDDA